MKILQYNILDGCREKDRYEWLSTWLKKEDYDVVGFNELNDWTQTEFENEMEKIGYQYSYVFEMESSPYLVGITAKWPIEVVDCVEENPIYHGMLHVRIRDVHFIIVHLTPFESEYRERETEEIAEYINDIQEPLAIMGDFNTLSPLDKGYYDAHGTYEKLVQRMSPARQHLQNNSINYRPMEILLESGLHDICHFAEFQYSMPTKIKGELIEPIYLRLDYVLVNSYLMDLMPEGEIIQDSDVEMLSDHYPVRFNFRLE